MLRFLFQVLAFSIARLITRILIIGMLLYAVYLAATADARAQSFQVTIQDCSVNPIGDGAVISCPNPYNPQNPFLFFPCQYYSNSPNGVPDGTVPSEFNPSCLTSWGEWIDQASTVWVQDEIQSLGSSGNSSGSILEVVNTDIATDAYKLGFFAIMLIWILGLVVGVIRRVLANMVPGHRNGSL